jgi:hypothetical protein
MGITRKCERLNPTTFLNVQVSQRFEFAYPNSSSDRFLPVDERPLNRIQHVIQAFPDIFGQEAQYGFE